MSPQFGARGLVYLGALDYWEGHVPGGVAAVRAQLEPELAGFLGQIFLASTMYDALPIVPLSQAAARVAGLPHAELVTRNARWIADRDIRGVYKLLLNVLSPDTVVRRLPKAAMRYFDFGQATAEVVGRGRCRMMQTGIPQPMAGWFSAAVDGFVSTAMTMAGAKSPLVRFQEPEAEGLRGTISTVRLRFDVEWS